MSKHQSFQGSEDEPVDRNIAETIADIAQRPIQLAESPTGRLIAVPEGYTLSTDHQLRVLDNAPTRKQGSVALRTVESFVQYVMQHKQAASQLYAKVEASSATTPLVVTAVFNDHHPGLLNETPAGWKDFRATFTPAPSPEWKEWIGRNGQKMSQAEFATFIEDNVHCFAGAGTDGGDDFPTGGDMLQMALNFEASSEKRVRSCIRLPSGGFQLEHVDKDNEATTTRMQAFERFRLGLPPFWRGDAYPLEAKLRYRAGQTLQLWYDLVRPDRLVDDAVDGILRKISEATGITPLFGTLEK